MMVPLERLRAAWDTLMGRCVEREVQASVTGLDQAIAKTEASVEAVEDFWTPGTSFQLARARMKERLWQDVVVARERLLEHGRTHVWQNDDAERLALDEAYSRRLRLYDAVMGITHEP